LIDDIFYNNRTGIFNVVSCTHYKCFLKSSVSKKQCFRLAFYNVINILEITMNHYYSTRHSLLRCLAISTDRGNHPRINDLWINYLNEAGRSGKCIRGVGPVEKRPEIRFNVVDCLRIRVLVCANGSLICT